MKTREKRMATLFQHRTLAIAVGALLALSGCSVSPKALTTTEHAKAAGQDFKRLFKNQEPVSGPVTVYEAMARAIRYNLDNRLKLMEQALAQQQLDLANLDMLPQVVANAGYESWDRDQGSSSQSLLTGQQSLEVSTSTERIHRVADLSFTWNILDFGLSYVRAQQQADRALIMEERRRKVIQIIIEDVRAAYWRAVSADRLIGRIDPLLGRVSAALADARQIEERKLQQPMDSLNYQRTLLDTLRQLHTLRRELSIAKTQLAALMNLPLDQEFQLVLPDQWSELPVIETELKEFEELALAQRPELREERYQSRITTKEARAALLEMLPGISLDYSWNYDGNRFLYTNHWRTSGARVSWNLMNLFSGPARKEVVTAMQEVDEARRLALNVAVLTQVHVAYQRVAETRQEYRVSAELSGVEERILAQLKAQTRTQRSGQLEEIRGELNAVIAELRRDLAFAEMQNAAGRLQVSAGFDPLPETINATDLSSLANAIKEKTGAWFGS